MKRATPIEELRTAQSAKEVTFSDLDLSMRNGSFIPLMKYFQDEETAEAVLSNGRKEKSRRSCYLKLSGLYRKNGAKLYCCITFEGLS